jgi:periplasmic protein TonB
MFAAALGQHQTQSKLSAGISVSVALHAAAFLAVFAYKAAAPSEDKPPEPVVMFAAKPAPPPPPPPPPASSSSKPKTKPKTPKPFDTPPKVIPKEMPKEEAKAPEPESSAPDVVGEPGGVVGGVVGGVPGGVVGGVVGSTGPVTAAPPKVVPSFVIDRERMSSPDPKLPDELATRYAGQSVKGTYRICIDTEGNVLAVTVVNSIPGADEQIVGHLKQTWKYKPQPVPVCTVRNFVFNVR